MLFESRDRAIANAREIAQGHAHPEYPEHLVIADVNHPGVIPDEAEEDADELLISTGWEFYARWSPEGDHLFVTGDLKPLDRGEPPRWPRG